MSIKIILTGILAFAFICLIASMSIDTTSTQINDIDNQSSLIPVLDIWSDRFLILGVGVLIGAITILVPISIEIKGIALIIEFVVGAIAWSFA